MTAVLCARTAAGLPAPCGCIARKRTVGARVSDSRKHGDAIERLGDLLFRGPKGPASCCLMQADPPCLPGPAPAESRMAAAAVRPHTYLNTRRLRREIESFPHHLTDMKNI